jgi:hypothetical protein
MQAPQDIMIQMILAQVTDLQRRVTHQESLIASLQHEIASLRTPQYIPQHHIPHQIPPTPTPTPTQTVTPTPTQSVINKPIRKRPAIVSQFTPDNKGDNRGDNRGDNKGDKSDRAQWDLSTLLHKDEEVEIQVGVGRNDRGAHSQFTTLTTIFDGKGFTVTGADDSAASSLVGFQSDKPGAILFRFIDALHSAGVIRDKFSIAPWKLCSVLRDGKRLTLEALAKGNQTILG